MECDTKQSIWEQLNALAESNLYKKRQSYIPSFIEQACHLTLDYSHQKLSERIIQRLIQLAEASHLTENIHALMRGETVNISENKPALHTALRAHCESKLLVNGVNVMNEVTAALELIKNTTEAIRNRQWLGFSGKPIQHIVNIGIGGSDLGPRFCNKAFSNLLCTDLSYHFISDVDPYHFQETLASLSPETTLFIIASKSFATIETLHNANKACSWLSSKAYMKTNCIAVTACPEKARQFGIDTIIPIWEWVGGRYSLCSAINLITAIAIGFDQFEELLLGARSMDTHFLHTDFRHNLPVLSGLIGIWNNNFLHRHNLLMLTYASQLESLVGYIQQLDMESNGKNIDKQGKPVSYATGPIIWGGLGNQAQHSYYQLLCQGTHKMAADFITVDTFNNELLNQMCLSKMKVLSYGVNHKTNPYHSIQGDLPINHIRIKDTTPFSIGALVAFYEHKIFTQSVIWNINPFDQPGVESAKRFNASSKASAMVS